MIMIEKITFTVLTPDIVRKMSVAKINKTDLYDQEGYPIEGGLMDPRLGIIDPGLRCRTCGGSSGDCKGHFGHLDLTRPVINVNYAKLIYNILKLTCRNCNRILLDEAGMEKFKKGKKSIKVLRNLIKAKCPYCDERQKKIKFIKPTTFVEGSTIMTVTEVRERLEKIRDEDLTMFGFKNVRPENFIISLLPVPPVTMRPSITLETGERSEDDLTHKLVDIVRINKRLKENIDLGAPEFIIQDLWELLQYHVATYMNNEISGVPPARHRSGRVLKTLTQRLKGKDGRFRHNLLGKRVNYSARTVISPDTMLDIDEVGVPLQIAEEITIPMVVNDKNIKQIKDLIINYPNWPTVNYILRTDGAKKKVTELNKDEVADKLEPGYIVERQMHDGDWVIFNRQPTLHRMGMMGHRVVVMPHRTFRLNTLNCPPYNADFDGDEMNLHVPQNVEAQVETKFLANSTLQIRSPRFSGPIIGASKDHIAGMFLLTANKIKLSREDAIDIVRFCNFDVDIPDKKAFDGKDIFSLFLPPDFSFEYKDKSDFVSIKNGKLVSGSVGSRGMGAFKGKILDELDKRYGHSFTKKFMFDISRISLEVLTRYGLSMSISDLDLPDEVHKETDKIIQKSEKEMDKLIDDFHKGKIKPIIGRSSRESIEILIKKSLADTLNDVTKVVKKHIPETSIVLMAKSGARGSIINIVQASCLVGQETVKGERIEIGFHKRTFSHFKEGDISLESKGFVKHGYKQGLSPFEFFFDAMNSREGLMDKSLKTRHSGYLERRLIGALKDLKVEYDGTVRDSNKKIVQFIPGEDGLDPGKIQKGGIDVNKIADRI
jgi:DNA-directed RNA polymerase subunit A'